MSFVEIIARKRDGKELSTDEIRSFIAGVACGIVQDYQAAAWLMAVYLRGMSRRETLDLTLAMVDSGERVDLSDSARGPTLDKHSTGGVGDKTSLVVVPILAAAGVTVLKMSGRALGYSGGTVDKLESIPGFRAELTIDEAKRVVGKTGAAIISQSSALAPADRVLYSLRDVTATIASPPLIAASIMSKKLSAGASSIVLDVKCGAGSFMKTREQAEHLATMLVEIGCSAGVPTATLISAMDVPLGYTVGNAVEVREAIQTLDSTSATLAVCLKFRNLCVELAARGLVMVGTSANMQDGRELAQSYLDSGAALGKFAEMTAAQGGPGSIEAILGSLPEAPHEIEVEADNAGFVCSIDAEAIGRLALEIGAGRLTKDARIDHSVGIRLHRKTGDRVSHGDRIASIYLNNGSFARRDYFAAKLNAAYTISDSEPVVADSLAIKWVE